MHQQVHYTMLELAISMATWQNTVVLSMQSKHVTSNFNHNSAYNGRAVVQIISKLAFIGINYFNNNSADYYGGTIYAQDNVVLIFNEINNFFNNS